MKKISILLLSVLMVFAFVSCEDTPVHEHSYGEWKSDVTSHWKECSCGEKIDEGNHSFELVLTGDKAVKKCSVCGYEIETKAKVIKDEDSLVKAATNGEGEYILAGDVELSKQVTISKPIVIDGNGKAISRKTPTDGTVSDKSIILVSSNNVVLKNLKVSGTDTQTNWNEGEFGIKVYNATNVVLENVSVANTNAGIQVNSSDVTLTGKIDVSGNTYGGIAVDQGSSLEKKGKLTIDPSSEVICTDENTPAIWLESADKAEIVGADKLFSYKKNSQIYFITDAQKGMPIDARVWDGEAIATNWYDQEKSEFSLNTAAELAGLAKLVNDGTADFSGKTIVLCSDIDLNSKAWTPIGKPNQGFYGDVYDKKDNVFNSFAGTFDGQKHIISNLYVESKDGGSTNPNQMIMEKSLNGLFGCVRSGSEIKNLTVNNAIIIGDSFNGVFVGYIPSSSIERTPVKLSNLQATGLIKFEVSSNAGGILGRNETGTPVTIDGCSVDAADGSYIKDTGGDSMTDFFGGIIGVAYSSDSNTIKNCSVNNLDVIGRIEGVGGFAGGFGKGSILNSSVSGLSVTLTNSTGYDGLATGAFIGVVIAGKTDLEVIDLSGSTASNVHILKAPSAEKIDMFTEFAGTYRSDSIEKEDVSKSLKNIPTDKSGITVSVYKAQ